MQGRPPPERRQKAPATMKYLGHLKRNDPLYAYFRREIIPQITATDTPSDFRVFRFNGNRDVYLYSDQVIGVKLVGKFFKRFDPDQARYAGQTEFNNLVFLRNLGLADPPHRVVRPYGFNADIDNVLVTEYVQAESLGSVIEGAIQYGNKDRFYRKLSALASFLAQIHHRTAGDWPVDFDRASHYFDGLLNTLQSKGFLGSNGASDFRYLNELWRNQACMWEDRSVLVHGDPTPSNLLIGHGADVTAIDLERMRWADRVFDLGRLCGEIKHFFFRATNDPMAGEPFIGHFLWEYARHFPDQPVAFQAITRRFPFYLGITFLRIARNDWVSSGYRKQLIQQAATILRSIP